jgi:nitroreductase
VADSGVIADPKLAALSARYGDIAVPEAGPWNPTIGGLLGHRSVRGYVGTPLPEGTLETLVAAAQSASTSSNLQTWSVIAVHDAGRKARLAKITGNQKHIEECPLFLAWLADLSRLERTGIAANVPVESLPYTENFLIAVVDAALAAQNAVVAAESLGLYTVYIGALRNDPVASARELGLPPHVMAVFGLCVGYAKPEAASAVKPRLPQGAVLHHDTYDASREQALRQQYDATLAAYSRQHDMAHASWTDRLVTRVASPKGLNGRDRMRQWLEAIGFPLR